MNPYDKKEKVSVPTIRPTSGSDVCTYMWGPSGIKSRECNIRAACGLCSNVGKGENKIWLKGVCGVNLEEQEYDVRYYIYGMKNAKMYFR